MMIFGQNKVASGKVVKLGYILTNNRGEELDRSSEDRPFEYLHGQGQIVIGLERELEGLGLGDKKKVVVAAKDGYGEVDPNLRGPVPKEHFPKDMPLEVGIQFRAELGQGPVMLRIAVIEGDSVVVDANHPLAGETLNFDVEVLAIRDATKEEMSHGHVHGPNGHHH